MRKDKMSILFIIGLLILGILAGYLSGLVGIGGGIIIVPALVLLFGFSQYMAQGTTLALLLPPIGLFAVINYYKKGYVDIKIALILIFGFLLGSYFGSLTAVNIPQETLKKIFAIILVLIGIKMFFG